MVLVAGAAGVSCDQPVSTNLLSQRPDAQVASAPLAVDAFDRANENPIAGAWTSGPSTFADLQLVSNSVRGVTASGEAIAYYNAFAWPADQWSEDRKSVV